MVDQYVIHELQGSNVWAKDGERLGLVDNVHLDRATGEPAWVGDGVRDACDSGVEKGLGARAGPTGVVARFERDDRGRSDRDSAAQLGECVDFRVRRTSAAVPAFRNHATGGIQNHTADLRVDAAGRSAAGKVEGAAHGVVESHSVSGLCRFGGIARAHRDHSRLRRAPGYTIGK